MLFMGVSVPDAANVCNESKVESYDTDIKYCPEFYAENEKENTTEGDSDINSDILEDDSVIGSLNEITKDKSDVTFYDIYESLKSGDVDSTIDIALKMCFPTVSYTRSGQAGGWRCSHSGDRARKYICPACGKYGRVCIRPWFHGYIHGVVIAAAGGFRPSAVHRAGHHRRCHGVHESVLSHVCLVCVICERSGECRIFTVGHNPGDIHLPECDNKVHTPPHQMRRAHSTHK